MSRTSRPTPVSRGKTRIDHLPVRRKGTAYGSASSSVACAAGRIRGFDASAEHAHPPFHARLDHRMVGVPDDANGIHPLLDPKDLPPQHVAVHDHAAIG